MRRLLVTLALLAALPASAGPSVGGVARGPPRVLWLGDSIAYGYGVATSPPATLQAQIRTTTGDSRWVVTNGAVSGYRAAQALSLWQGEYDGRGAAYDVAVVSVGVNDIVNDGTAAATVYGTIDTLIDGLLADGVRVIVTTVLPCSTFAGWSAADQVQLEALNASIAGTAGVTVVDAYAAFGESGTPEQLAAAYDSGDHIHPNQAGATLLADLVHDALLAGG